MGAHEAQDIRGRAHERIGVADLRRQQHPKSVHQAEKPKAVPQRLGHVFRLKGPRRVIVQLDVARDQLDRDVDVQEHPEGTTYRPQAALID